MSGKNTNIIPSPINMATTFVAHLGRNKLGTACKVEVSLLLRSLSTTIQAIMCEGVGERVGTEDTGR